MSRKKLPLLLFTTLIFLVSFAAFSKPMGAQNNSINVFLSNLYKQEAGFQWNMLVSSNCKDNTHLSYCALDQNTAASGSSKPGQQYTARGCESYYGCRSGT